MSPTTGRDQAERRARRLLALYPPAWRVRYGDEFTQFLVDDIRERPLAPSRGLDVLRGGARARVAARGWSEDVAPLIRLRAGLAVSGVALGAFGVLGLALWSQLTVSWQWAAPVGGGTRLGMYLMSIGLVLLFAVGACALAPLLWVLGAGLRRGDRRLIGPLVLAGLALLVLVVGGLDLGRGWPGTGGHPWPGRDLLPTQVARLGWALTLWMSAYWAHPGRLATFPGVEVAWMFLCPLALAVLAGALGTAVARASVTRRVLALEARLSPAFAVAMIAFLLGALAWVGSSAPAPHGLFQVGGIDIGAVVAMGVVLAVLWRAAAHALGAVGRLDAPGAVG